MIVNACKCVLIKLACSALILYFLCSTQFLCVHWNFFFVQVRIFDFFNNLFLIFLFKSFNIYTKKEFILNFLSPPPHLRKYLLK